MILHRLIARHLTHGDDTEFYRIQALDAIRWMKGQGLSVTEARALDLGCGHGVFGAELMKLGAAVTFADESRYLDSSIKTASFTEINIDAEEISSLGRFNLVVCSNVLEHLSQPDRFIGSMHELLEESGYLYLSWTNWLSPWGGHDFSPFHYLGPTRGHLIFDRLIGRKRIHTPFETLYPTYIGSVLRSIRRNSYLELVSLVPRYYPELGFLMAVPGLREFLAWNCAVLLKRVEGAGERRKR